MRSILFLLYFCMITRSAKTQVKSYFARVQIYYTFELKIYESNRFELIIDGYDCSAAYINYGLGLIENVNDTMAYLYFDALPLTASSYQIDTSSEELAQLSVKVDVVDTLGIPIEDVYIGLGSEFLKRRIVKHHYYELNSNELFQLNADEDPNYLTISKYGYYSIRIDIEDWSKRLYWIRVVLRPSPNITTNSANFISGGKVEVKRKDDAWYMIRNGDDYIKLEQR